MQWTGLNELREKFLSFFEGKAHVRMASASLVPQGDKSLLLINSGMAPLKKFFLGQAVPPSKRVATCQKCIRTPDIERVGKTARHGTYFEMLGNFSFGDYFKIDATAWAWEFFTEVLGMPVDKLYISVYEHDDEAYDIWTQKIGIAEDHMARMGKADNFWEHGSGPCGPCSEIYFDRGDEKGCGSPDCKVGCECDRFVEVWNLVFSQFDSDGNGNYAEMENKNIDTGMGLERLACVMQGVDNLFEVDTVQSIMNHICEIGGVQYKKDAKTDVSLRVITDHIRSTAFMVGDGVMPSNEGRGYVLRRLLRRAARHGRMIGITEPFLNIVCETVIRENECAYPELREKADYIKKIISVEEDSFAKTVEKGLELLNALLADKNDGNSVLSGADAFKLSDTFGFPIDLTVEICEERGFTVDMDGYAENVKMQREMARADHFAKASSSWADSSIQVDVPQTEFVGYEKIAVNAALLAIYSEKEKTDLVNEGDNAVIILDKSPFYAESGGQISDSGVIKNDSGVFSVKKVSKTENGHYLHVGFIAEGSLKTSDEVFAEVDRDLRMAVMRNHTAAHLLQAALRQVLGDHVHQAGQLVDSERCRFDFSHFNGMTVDELQTTEKIVNDKILSSIEVSQREMAIEEAKELGAMALFGEKYGDIVRVVTVDDFSLEFCGGTHVKNTSQVGLFKILSESSVAAGVRRIEAVTGSGVLEVLNGYKDTINQAAKAIKLANPLELAEKCASMFAENKEKDRQIEALNQWKANSALSGIISDAKEINGIKLMVAKLDDANADMLRKLGDSVRDKVECGIALFAGISEGKAMLYCSCTPDAVKKGANAGKIVREISAITGGKGGGRSDGAMAGVGDISLLDKALAASETVIGNL